MRKLALAALLACAAAPAMAHPGHGSTGMEAGLLHPFLGLDHLLAMVTVGLWSGLALPRRAWGGAAAFLAAMTAGAGLAWAGVALPFVEGWITLSVVVFGLMVVLARPGRSTLATAGTLAAIAAFALSHGHAHGAEATGAAGAYLAGFLLATGALHLAGIVLARRIAGQPVMTRALGAGVALSGLALALT
jgi:urease accessory protein